MTLSQKTRRVLYFVLFLGALVAVSLLLQDVFENLVVALARYEAARPVLGPLLFVVLAAASVMLGPFTSAPLMPFAVGVWGTGKTLALLLTGWLAGNAAAYGIGYHFGYPVVSLIVPAAVLQKWIRFLREGVSAWGIFLIRLAVPAEIGYVFGLLKYDFRKYLAVVFLAEVPFAVALVYGGEAFLNGRWPRLITYVTGIVALIATALILSNAERKRRTAAGQSS